MSEFTTRQVGAPNTLDYRVYFGEYDASPLVRVIGTR